MLTSLVLAALSLATPALHDRSHMPGIDLPSGEYTLQLPSDVAQAHADGAEAVDARVAHGRTPQTSLCGGDRRFTNAYDDCRRFAAHRFDIQRK